MSLNLFKICKIKESICYCVTTILLYSFHVPTMLLVCLTGAMFLSFLDNMWRDVCPHCVQWRPLLLPFYSSWACLVVLCVSLVNLSHCRRFVRLLHLVRDSFMLILSHLLCKLHYIIIYSGFFFLWLVGFIHYFCVFSQGCCDKLM